MCRLPPLATHGANTCEGHTGSWPAVANASSQPSLSEELPRNGRYGDGVYHEKRKPEAASASEKSIYASTTREGSARRVPSQGCHEHTDMCAPCPAPLRGRCTSACRDHVHCIRHVSSVA
jgi:hypothetical protein